jgi:hypothetical protein
MAGLPRRWPIRALLEGQPSLTFALGHTTRSSNMTSLGKRIVGGAGIAAGGAFVWALFSFAYWFSQRHNPGETLFHVIMYAGYAVVVASWFVLPLGAMIGVVMPHVVSRCSRRAAFFRGAVVGVGTAVIAALLTSVLMEWATITGQATIVDRDAWWRAVTHRFVFNLTTMSLICAVWVGVWAVRWSRKVWPNHALQRTAAPLSA